MLAYRKVRFTVFCVCLFAKYQNEDPFKTPPPLGVIRTALSNMDREVKGEYQVLLQAKDMGGQLGGLASTTTINITLSDVNDNPPRFAKSKKVSLWMSEWLIY